MYHFGVFPLWWLALPPCPVGNMSYDTESKSRNADFISIAAERQSATFGPKGPVKLKNPPAVRPVNPKNLSL